MPLTSKYKKNRAIAQNTLWPKMICTLLTGCPVRRVHIKMVKGFSSAKEVIQVYILEN